MKRCENQPGSTTGNEAQGSEAHRLVMEVAVEADCPSNHRSRADPRDDLDPIRHSVSSPGSVAVVFQRSVYEPKTRDHENTEARIHENIDHEGSPPDRCDVPARDPSLGCSLSIASAWLCSGAVSDPATGRTASLLPSRWATLRLV